MLTGERSIRESDGGRAPFKVGRPDDESIPDWDEPSSQSGRILVRALRDHHLTPGRRA